MDEFEHLKIQLEEIKKATSNFSKSLIIGSGGFGKVYEGEASHSKGRSMVAIKRLDRRFGQGDPEFWKEIMMLSRYTHTNLISLLGFCDEDGEKILVYEHASNGSLDRHLSSGSLSWAQRIKICLDTAQGLSYLHDHKGTQQRILHRDIKSANILLDYNWNAKLSDMGLSKLGPANQLHTIIYTNVVGTPGYCDPQYMMTYTLTKESNIYSLGVVLFEVLCGRLCFELDSNRELRVLVSTWKESYKNKRLEKIIFKDPATPMDKTSLETFVGIAFQCVQESREQRPKISVVVEKLQTTLKLQKRYEMKLSSKYNDKEIIEVVETRPKHRYLENVISHGKRFFLGLGTPTSLKTFVDIAFQCVHESREQRPKISVVEKLQTALKLQERYEMKLSSKFDDEEIIEVVETRFKHRYLEDLISHGKRFFLGFGRRKRIDKHSEQPPEVIVPKSASGAGTSTKSERNKLVFLDTGIYSFDLDDLYEAKATILGKGSVGTSFKAVLDDGMMVVVKRLRNVVVEEKKFESTMKILGQMSSEHLIPLKAFYYSKDDKLLVYDYLQAGSLSARLHEKDYGNRTNPLDWDYRMRIAWSVARGVAYVHEVGKLVHGNIKSSNILLQQEDTEYALVSGFGLNRLFGINHHVPGYSAPEVLEDQKLTFESDIYSFGVLLLELLTGKAPNNTLLGEDLPRWVRDIIREEWSSDVFDVELIRYQNIEPEMIQLLQIAMECVATLPNQRPSMNDVVRKIYHINQAKFNDTSINL